MRSPARPGSRKRESSRRTHLFLRDESGQVIPWVATVMIVCLVAGGLVIDIGHALIVQRQLQDSADAEALSAAAGLPSLPSSTQQNYTSASGQKNVLSGVTVGTPAITGLCLTTLISIGLPCTSTSPNAVRVKETASVPTLFAGLFGVQSIPVSATSTAAAKGASPAPYNVAIIVDSTLSMAAPDGSSSCSGETQETCALNGVLQLLGQDGGGTRGLSPSIDHVALFTFPNVAAGSSNSSVTTGSKAGIVIGGSWTCTTAMPQSFGGQSYPSQSPFGYLTMLRAQSTTSRGRNGNTTTTWSGTNNIPYTGAAWAMPYTFPAIPADASGYVVGSGSLAPTYEVVPFSSDYRTSDGATTLNTSSALVQAAGGESGCGGLEPSNYDGNYGTYYAGAIYAAQAALLAEQANNPGSTNVMIILGDGNSNGSNPSNAVNSQTPAMPSTAAQAASTYLTTSQLTTTAYTMPSSYLLATSSGTYPSWVGDCGQAVDAAHYAATYHNNPTVIYSIAYGAPTTSSSTNCLTDVHAGSNPNISPCSTMQKIASSPVNFFSDYNVVGGDSGCQATDTNNTVTTLNQIFKVIKSDLLSVRLIPNDTP